MYDAMSYYIHYPIERQITNSTRYSYDEFYFETEMVKNNEPLSVCDFLKTEIYSVL